MKRKLLFSALAFLSGMGIVQAATYKNDTFYEIGNASKDFIKNVKRGESINFKDFAVVKTNDNKCFDLKIVLDEGLYFDTKDIYRIMEQNICDSNLKNIDGTFTTFYPLEKLKVAEDAPTGRQDVRVFKKDENDDAYILYRTYVFMVEDEDEEELEYNASPSDGTYTPGQNFNFKVNLNNPQDISINAEIKIDENLNVLQKNLKFILDDEEFTHYNVNFVNNILNINIPPKTKAKLEVYTQIKQIYMGDKIVNKIIFKNQEATLNEITINQKRLVIEKSDITENDGIYSFKLKVSNNTDENISDKKLIMKIPNYVEITEASKAKKDNDSLSWDLNLEKDNSQEFVIKYKHIIPNDIEIGKELTNTFSFRINYGTNLMVDEKVKDVYTVKKEDLKIVNEDNKEETKEENDTIKEEEKIDNPQTGTKSVLLFIVFIVVLAGGLYYIKKNGYLKKI